MVQITVSSGSLGANPLSMGCVGCRTHSKRGTPFSLSGRAIATRPGGTTCLPWIYPVLAIGDRKETLGTWMVLKPIYVVVEPDNGGEAVVTWLSVSAIRHRVKLVSLVPHKDIRSLYLADPAGFRTNLLAALNQAMPWTEYATSLADTEHSEAWRLAAPLAKAPRILDTFAEGIKVAGVVAEQKATSLLYICPVSRFFAHPVSAAVKGPSAAGKTMW